MTEKRLTYVLLMNNYYQIREVDDDGSCRRLSPTGIIDLLNEQQATINLLLNLLYQSEATVIYEYSSNIGEDMDKLDKIFKEKDIKEIERFVGVLEDE